MASSISGQAVGIVPPKGSKEDVELLDALSAEVARMPAAYREAQQGRDLQQRRLNELLEETVRQIKKARAHMQQKSKHVMDTSKTYTAKFEHELAGLRELLRRDLGEAVDALEAELKALEVRMAEAEVALQEQTRNRKADIEANLGPIRDEGLRLTAALENERRVRRLQEEERDKLLLDEIEAVTKIIDQEKFAREHQLTNFLHWQDAEHQRVAKRQYELEKETRDTVAALRTRHQATAKERIDSQHRIVESIASFVRRYRASMDE